MDKTDALILGALGGVGTGVGYLVNRYKLVTGVSREVCMGAGAIGGLLLGAVINATRSVAVGVSLPPGKRATKELYQRLASIGSGRFYIYPNEMMNFAHVDCASFEPRPDCPSDSIIGWVAGPVLKCQVSCTQMTDEERAAIIQSGLSWKPQCFDCVKSDGSSFGYNYCHVLYSNRELSADELWLTNLRQRAVDLGYVVVDVPEAPIGWGIYGDSNDSAYAAFEEFSNRTGVSGQSGSYASNGGYAWTFDIVYAQTMVGITQF